MRHAASHVDIIVRVCLCCSMVVAPCVVGQAAARRGVITGDGVSVRQGPAVAFERLGRLQAGDEVTILAEEGGWYRIEGEDERPSWVFAKWVHEIPADSLPVAPVPGVIAHDPSIEPESFPSVLPSPPLVPETHKGGLPWLWIGAGAVATGVVTALVLSGGEDKDTGSLSFHVVFP
ncbi:SH3 domain-containing protein [Candidatus Fermentibacteria bacterium]|nr:SH3 domain-containing protein [Candidatus Fermentibacteria bacterium]